MLCLRRLLSCGQSFVKLRSLLQTVSVDFVRLVVTFIVPEVRLTVLDGTKALISACIAIFVASRITSVHSLFLVIAQIAFQQQ
jgi:succinate-acetate transporter protein